MSTIGDFFGGVGDVVDGLGDVLVRGVGAWTDLETARNPVTVIPYGPNPYQYSSGASPTAPGAMNTAGQVTTTAPAGTWIPGVPNSVTLIGGAVLLVIMARA